MRRAHRDAAASGACGSDTGEDVERRVVNINANGSGDAQLSIPIHGSKGKGTAYSHAVRTAGNWSMRLLVVRVEGVDAPIVLTNEDHVPIPNAAIGI